MANNIDTVAKTLSGVKKIAVLAGDALSTSDTAIKWNGPSTGAIIENSGIIESVGIDGRAINASGTSVGDRVLRLINHSGAVIQSENDAFRVNIDFSVGSIIVENSGTIISKVGGQAIDFDAVVSAAPGTIKIVNEATGVIQANGADAIRPGQGAAVVNHGLVYSDGVLGDKNDGVDFQIHSGSVVNLVGGIISGQRHGIVSSTDVTVFNAAGASIMGRNGSGVGSDGTGKVTNYGTITGAYVGTGAGDPDGVDIDGYGEIDNWGIIEATTDGAPDFSEGVVLTGGGYIHNYEGAVIRGPSTGITAANGVNIVNDGTIQGGWAISIFSDTNVTNTRTGVIFALTGRAIWSQLGGVVVNNQGLIKGDLGVAINGTLVNSGSIVSNYYAVVFGGVDNTLVVQAGSHIAGIVLGSLGNNDVVILQEGSVFDSAQGFDRMEVSGSAQVMGSSTFGSVTVHHGAKLTIGDGGQRGLVSGPIINDGEVVLNRSNAVVLVDAISGSGGLSQVGSGVLTLSATESYTGLTNIASGVLAIDENGSISSSSGVVANGTFDVSGAISGASISTLSGIGKVLLGANDLSLTAASGTFDGSITGTGGLTVAAGQQALSGTNGYGGVTTIAAQASLALIGSGSIAASVMIVDDGMLDFSGLTSSMSIGTVSGHGVINLGANRLSLQAARGVFEGSITGTGSLALTGVAGHQITLAGTAGWQGSTTIAAGNTLILQGDYSALSGTIAVAGALDITAAGVLASSLSGVGSFVKVGPSIVTLTGSGSFSGIASILGGTLVLQSESALGTAAIDLSRGDATLAVGAGITLANEITGFGLGDAINLTGIDYATAVIVDAGSGIQISDGRGHAIDLGLLLSPGLRLTAASDDNGDLLLRAGSVATLRPDVATTTEDAPVTLNVLANDIDVYGPAPSVAGINGQAIHAGYSVTLASGATVTLAADGTLSYDPHNAFDYLVSAAAAARSGSAGTQATDSFLYANTDGTTATVTVTINGVDGIGDEHHGSAGDDIITGSDGGEIFDLSQGGTDSAVGGVGNDAFYLGAALTAQDRIDGGAGLNDQVGLKGDYSGSHALVLSDTTLTNIEVLAVLPGKAMPYSYEITSDDATVSAGQTFTVFGGNLATSENFTFDGSAETNGAFLFFGGLGTDNFTGGAKNDGFFFGPDKFATADVIHGGDGLDQLGLDGHSGALTLDATHTDVEVLALLRGVSNSAPNEYGAIIVDPSWVSVGQTKTITAVTSFQSSTGPVLTPLNIDGSRVTNGNLNIYSGSGDDAVAGGAGADHIYGGLGADTLTGGGSADVFIYNDAQESTGINFDTLTDFDMATDSIKIAFEGLGSYTSVQSGVLSTSSFDFDLQAAVGEQLISGHAVLFAPTTGDYAGETFLLVDGNGTAGYQVGGDFVFHIPTVSLPTTGLADFITH